MVIIPLSTLVATAFAAVAAQGGDPELAARRLGAARQIRGTDDLGNVDAYTLGRTLRETLGDERFDELVGEGAALPRDRALDLGLPDGSGLDLLHDLRAAGWQRLVVLSAADDPYSVRAAFVAGAQGYLLKSASPVVVADGVRRVDAGAVSPERDAATLVAVRGREEQGLVVDTLEELVETTEIRTTRPHEVPGLWDGFEVV